MITFTGLCLIGFAYFMLAALKASGLWKQPGELRWTDWLVLAPWLSGIGCLLYVLGIVCARHLP